MYLVQKKNTFYIPIYALQNLTKFFGQRDMIELSSRPSKNQLGWYSYLQKATDSGFKLDKGPQADFAIPGKGGLPHEDMYKEQHYINGKPFDNCNEENIKKALYDHYLQLVDGQHRIAWSLEYLKAYRKWAKDKVYGKLKTVNQYLSNNRQMSIDELFNLALDDRYKNKQSNTQSIETQKLQNYCPSTDNYQAIMRLVKHTREIINQKNFVYHGYHVSLVKRLIPISVVNKPYVYCKKLFDDDNNKRKNASKYSNANSRLTDNFINIPSQQLGCNELLRDAKAVLTGKNKNQTVKTRLGDFAGTKIDKDHRKLQLSTFVGAVGLYALKRMPALMSISRSHIAEMGYAVVLRYFAKSRIKTSQVTPKVVKDGSIIHGTNTFNYKLLIHLNQTCTILNYMFADKLLRNNGTSNDNNSGSPYTSSRMPTLALFAYLGQIFHAKNHEIKALRAKIWLDYLCTKPKGRWDGNGASSPAIDYAVGDASLLDENYTYSNLGSFHANLANAIQYMQLHCNKNGHIDDITKVYATIYKNEAFHGYLKPSVKYEYDHALVTKAEAEELDSGKDKDLNESELGNIMPIPKVINDYKNVHTLYQYCLNHHCFNTDIKDTKTKSHPEGMTYNQMMFKSDYNIKDDYGGTQPKAQHDYKVKSMKLDSPQSLNRLIHRRTHDILYDILYPAFKRYNELKPKAKNHNKKHKKVTYVKPFWTKDNINERKSGSIHYINDKNDSHIDK